jgi:hypothetical protein
VTVRIIRIMFIAALLAGCSDSTAPAVINGTYTLQTLRGDRLPAVVQEGADYAFKITAGSITLNGDLTFSDSYSYWEYNAGIVTTGTVPCTGRWTPTSERMFNLSETAINGCGQTGVGEWDGRNHLTVAWNVIGTGVHGR